MNTIWLGMVSYMTGGIVIVEALDCEETANKWLEITKQDYSEEIFCITIEPHEIYTAETLP